jgi:hypothetical protein
MVANDSINLSRRFKIGKVERYECRYVEWQEEPVDEIRYVATEPTNL